jgi:hypothetical protein
MAYDRYHDDDDLRSDYRRERDRDRDRERGFFRGGRDDRDEASRSERLRHRDDRPRDRDDRDQRPRGRDDRAPVPVDETRDLIPSNKVEGTAVYGRDDQRLGTIKTLMIDKYRGQVRYAVLSQGTGFLGLDEQYFPVKWEELRYDERRQGYRVDFTGEDVRYTLERRQRQQQDRARNMDEEWRRRM